MTGLDVPNSPGLPAGHHPWRHPIATLLGGAAGLRHHSAKDVRRGVWFVRRLLLSWTGRRRFASLRALLAALVAIPLFVLFASSLLAPLKVWPVWFTPFDASCEKHGFACNAMTELFAFAFALPAGFLLFLTLRLSRVKGRYIAAIRMRPDRLFPSWTSRREIVGRDALCDLIDVDFALHGVVPRKRSRKRRPRIIVGDIGSGKTGVLVRLAQVLAERGAVPVPVRLRNAGEDLDFVELARAEFISRTQRYVLDEDEGDRIWRWLLETGSIVILADGLEEVLLGSTARETRIRVAIARAMNDEDDVPIVISSRPAPYLATLDAAVIRLEPLPSADAVSALSEMLHDRARAETLVAKAGVNTMPFALGLLGDLAEQGRLEDLDPALDGVRLRIELLDRWIAWRTEESRAWSELSEGRREAAMRTLEALAAIALRQDSLAVRSKTLHRSRWRAVLVGVDESNYEATARLAADLDLVEDTGDGVQFRNNLAQAYLGSRALRRVLAASADESFLSSVHDAHGRELLMAIVFACAGQLEPESKEHARDWLVARAGAPDLTDDARLAMLAAAAEVERAIDGESTTSVAHVVCHEWPAARRRDEQRDDAKRRVLRRLGQLAVEPAFEALWDICRRDEDPVTRFAAAHEIARGGDLAFFTLRERIELGGQVAASVAPSLAHHCRDTEAIKRLGDLIETWAKGAARTDPDVESALAQGLRRQSNHRGANPDVRERLAGAATTLLRQSSWWNTVVLLQALTLWELSRTSGRRLRSSGTIDAWLDDNPMREHAFVRAERRLCRCTLRTRQPGRFLWIDEALSIRRIGSGAVRPTPELWLAPTGGWLSLEPRAQQLLADVVLLLNRDGFPEHDAEGPLPLCISKAEHRAAILSGGRTGTCCGAGTCNSRSDELPWLGDISASFARSQQRSLNRSLRWRARAPWQKGRRRDYLAAWTAAAKSAPE